MLVQEFFYMLDAAGKATEVRVTLPGNVIRREGYSYDRFDRLTQVIYADDGTIDANDRTQIWTYDGNGNRLTQTTKVNNAVTEVGNYTYGNENRLLNVTDQTGATVAEYRYDSAGNRIQKITPASTTNYGYDERNLLVSFADGGVVMNSAYDGDGHRIAKTVNGVTTTFVIDAARPAYESMQERNDVGVVSSAIFGLARLDTVAGNTPTFELMDRLGSVRLTADAVGAVSGTFEYEAYGKANATPVATHGHMFAGERLDAETGSVFLRSRCYDSETGTFLSKDRLGVVSGTNTFTYCHQNPINYTDSLGFDEFTDSLVRYSELMGQLDTEWKSLLDQGQDLALRTANVALGTIAVVSAATVLATTAPVTVTGAAITGLVSGVSAHDGLVQVANGLAGNPEAKGTFEQLGTLVLPTRDGERLGSAVGFAAGLLTPSNWMNRMTDSLAAVRSIADSASSIANTNYQSLFPISLGADAGYAIGGSRFSDVAASANVGLASRLSSDTFSSLFRDRSEHSIVLPPGGGGSGALNVGGVLLDKAATLVGTNLSDLRGAVYDPVTGQFVFLGTDGGAAVKDINLDYLYTALQAVYGSAVPPFVTLDPPASAYTQWTDFGNGNGAFDPTEKGGFTVRYNPVWSEEDTTVDITIHTGNGDWIARFNCVAQNIIFGNGRRAMKMVFASWVSAPPAGVTLDTTPWQSGIFTQTSARFNQDGQDVFTRFTLTNNGASTYVVNGIEVLPARHHRKYGGRVEASRLGWVMLEADRVMKCLSVGKDNLTTAPYNSGTINIAGYKNVGEIAIANGGTTGGNIRMWFTPNEMTLKRHLDPATGRASIVFDQASVKLNTESFILGLPQPQEARTFADFMTANYDAFAALSFPCVDPADPTGVNIIQVKIFDQLRDVMRAVSLARFFRDNAVPVDMWWLNSWQVPVSYSPKSTPAVTNTVSGGGNSVVMYGGVQVAKPNAYVPSATAKSVADVVQSSHPDVTGKPNGDLKEQVWSATTVEGGLKAVAASTKAEAQDGAINLAEVDLSFPSPGALPLQFVRYYQSSYLGRYCMGPGWRFTPFVLEFERPSWYDENGLMKNAGTKVYSDTQKNTRLRSGAVRVVDLRTGGVLDFQSSLELGYDVSNTGNVVITLAGLDASGLPTFTPGQRQGGATLAQLVDATDQRKYKLTSPDGAELTFDHEGRLLQTKDRNGKTQTYAWNAQGCLTTLTDQAAQTLTMAYDPVTMKLLSVTGPHSEVVNYTYTPEGCLLRATHARSTAFVEYRYNSNCQLDKKTRFNGLKAFESAPDLKGRAEAASDVRGNAASSTFTQDAVGSVRTTQTADPLVNDAAFMPARRPGWRRFAKLD